MRTGQPESVREFRSFEEVLPSYASTLLGSLVSVTTRFQSHLIVQMRYPPKELLIILHGRILSRAVLDNRLIGQVVALWKSDSATQSRMSIEEFLP